MYINNQRASLAYKLIAAAICLAGQIVYVSSLGLSQWLFYTNQSNLLCLAYFIAASIYTARRLRAGDTAPAVFSPRFTGAVVMAITVTMIIFWGMLSSTDFQMDAETSAIIAELPAMITSPWPNYVVHLVVPLLTIFDWLLFAPKGSFKRTDPVIWLLIPYVYWVFAIVVAQTGYTFWRGSRYPYYFIDTDALGWGKVLLYVLALTAFFLVLGYLLLLLDKALKRRAVKAEAK